MKDSEGSEPIKLTEKHRIEKEAYLYVVDLPLNTNTDAAMRDYIAGALAQLDQLKKRIYQIEPRDGKHFPEGWSREEIITILFEKSDSK